MFLVLQTFQHIVVEGNFYEILKFLISTPFFQAVLSSHVINLVMLLCFVVIFILVVLCLGGGFYLALATKAVILSSSSNFSPKFLYFLQIRQIS